MPPETPAGVSVLPDAAAFPVPAPPGVVVVPAIGAVGAATDIAVVLGVEGCCSLAEAATLLEDRRAALLEEPAQRVRSCGSDAAAAWAAVGKARPRLSAVPAGLTADAVRSAVRHVSDVAEVLHVAREAVGDRPGYDEEQAGAVRGAQADVAQSRIDRAAALPRANAILVQANVGAVLIVAGRVVTEAFDRAFFLVAALPLGALGYAAYTVIAPARRARAAARRRWSALRTMNVSTLAGLAALEQRAGAWERRAETMKAAEVDLRKAGDAWRALVGAGVALASAERLAADLEAATAVEQAARDADDAWAAAAVALQEAEDIAGAGTPPLVVVDPDPEADPWGRLRALEQLVDLAGGASVILVLAQPAEIMAPAAKEEPQDDLAAVLDGAQAPVALPPPSPVPVGAVAAVSPGGNGTLDVRERVRAGLVKLRQRAVAPRRPGARDSVAAEG